MNWIKDVVEKGRLVLSIDQTLQIQALSQKAYEIEAVRQYVGQDLNLFLVDLFVNDDFYNETIALELMQYAKAALNGDTVQKKLFTVSDDSLASDYVIRFVLSIEVLKDDLNRIMFCMDELTLIDSKYDLYKLLFDDYPDAFHVLQSLRKIGMFVIDYTVSKNLLYANRDLPELIGIKPTTDNTYVVTRYADQNAKNRMVRDADFFVKMDMLIAGEIDNVVDEWPVGDRHLRLESKVLKRKQNGDCLLVGGIVYDVSTYRDYEDLQYQQSIYELAINSGGIGIFHYDVDKYGQELFEANAIYANLFGLTPVHGELYRRADFEDALMTLEEDISSNIDVKKSLNRLISGEIEGTTDQILKIYNRKTEHIVYLLSSSKIDVRYPDGTPKRFGGIAIDISERIRREKSQIKFAYTDELTRLANNRKLAKDMLERPNGIGLFFDLDNFKKVNDKFGHLIGDEVLQLFASAIQSASSSYTGVTPYRLYGDEFFVFAENRTEEFAREFEIELSERIEYKLETIVYEVTVEASMGFSFYTVGMDIDDFIKEADYSMYTTKINKKKKKKQKKTKRG